MQSLKSIISLMKLHDRLRVLKTQNQTIHGHFNILFYNKSCMDIYYVNVRMKLLWILQVKYPHTTLYVCPVCVIS